MTGTKIMNENKMQNSELGLQILSQQMLTQDLKKNKVY